MGRYYKLIAHIQEEGTTYAPAAGAMQTSPYFPSENAKLTGLRIMPGRTAATTLLDQKQIKLTSNTFKPNAIEVGVVGSGLQTAPAAQPVPIDFDVMQDVQAGVPITIESRDSNASAVTNDILVFGRFES